MGGSHNNLKVPILFYILFNSSYPKLHFMLKLVAIQINRNQLLLHQNKINGKHDLGKLKLYAQL